MDGVHDKESDLVRVYRALGDLTRLRMVRLLLARGEMGCAELAEALNLSRPTLSYHTRMLQLCRLVDVRREGAYHYYRLRLDTLQRFAPEVARLDPLQ
ncbi:MAG: metalloregulator ArsR/SmtB family transcription factor [Bacillota bacterium]